MNKHVVWGVFGTGLYSHKEAITKAVTDVFGGDTPVRIWFRNYDFEDALEQAPEKPTLVLSNGKTKTQRPGHDGSVGIYYSVARPLKKFGLQADVISPTFFGPYSDKVFRFKLKLYRWLHGSNLVLA